MTVEPEKHAVKHLKNKTKELGPLDFTVKFSPELAETLHHVIEAVRYSPHFDGNTELFEGLKSFAEGTDVRMVVRLMKDITDGVQKHTKATQDSKAQEAWSQFSMQLIDPPGGKTPFVLIQTQKARELSRLNVLRNSRA